MKPPRVPGEMLGKRFPSPRPETKYRLGGYRCAAAAHWRHRSPASSDTDLRPSRYFGLSDGWWLRARPTHYRRVRAKRWAKPARIPRCGPLAEVSGRAGTDDAG